jgi:stage II sporulation protein D
MSVTLTAGGLALPAWITVQLFAARPVDVLTLRSPVPWVLRSTAGSKAIPAAVAVRFERVHAGVRAHWPGSQGLAGRWLPDGRGPWLLDSGSQRREVAGRLTLAPAGRALALRAAVPLEAFVEAALPAELHTTAPPAAQAAQAICIRTFAARSAEAPRHAGAALCDATHCLRFATAAEHGRRQAAAVHETAGRVVVWQQRPALTVWHAACGGRLAPADVAFGGGAVPYLPGGPDARPGGGAWCEGAHGAGAWDVEVPRAVAEAALAEGGLWPRGALLRGMVVSGGTAGGAVSAVRLTGEVSREVSGVAFWHALGPRLGWRGLRSLSFALTPSPDGWVARGRGLGHAVGLCQAGAMARARAGQEASAILAAYYPGTGLARGRTTGAASPW